MLTGASGAVRSHIAALEAELAAKRSEVDELLYLRAEDEALIRNLELERDEARAQEREACALAAIEEKVSAETGEESDLAYNLGIDHAVAAIRARKE